MDLLTQIVLTVANLPLPSNISGPQDFFCWGDSVTSGLFTPGIIMALFAIMLIGQILARFKIGPSILSSSVVCSLLAFLAIKFACLPGEYLLLFIATAIIGFLITLTEGIGNPFSN